MHSFGSPIFFSVVFPYFHLLSIASCDFLVASETNSLSLSFTHCDVAIFHSVFNSGGVPGSARIVYASVFLVGRKRL